ncbi:hypothetical protein ACF3MZ_11210 [Paenibacillaceae bacterium WGS1546]|uniref:hypothetical protein n=1 Tax=Cohnella sp. WGS1546 TaxID=3366810 RepID=UPI00372D10D8
MSVYNGNVKFINNKLHLLLAFAVTKIGLLSYMVITYSFSLWRLLIVSGVIGLIMYLELLHAEYRSRSQLHNDELVVMMVRFFGAVKLIKSYTVDTRLYELIENEVKDNTLFTLTEIHKNLNVHLVFLKENKAG